MFSTKFHSLAAINDFETLISCEICIENEFFHNLARFRTIILVILMYTLLYQLVENCRKLHAGTYFFPSILKSRKKHIHLHNPENLLDSFSFVSDVSSKSINESLPLPSEKNTNYSNN